MIFQPHTYSRTRALLADFAHALDAADTVIVTDIYPSRETNTLGMSSADIVAAMLTPATLARTPADAAALALDDLRDGDVALVMGAGDVYLAAQQLARGAS